MSGMHMHSSVCVVLVQSVLIGITLLEGTNGTGWLFQLPSGHRPGPFYDRQGANIVQKPWTDTWGCSNSPDYIRDVPQPFLNQNQNGRFSRSSEQSRDERQREGRILYSDPAGRNDFPYTVSIANLAVPTEGAKAPTLGSKSETGRRVCAGAIINRRHIVTAASCLSGEDQPDRVNKDARDYCILSQANPPHIWDTSWGIFYGIWGAWATCGTLLVRFEVTQYAQEELSRLLTW